MLTVAFFSDKHMLPGLHVALLSLLNSLDSSNNEPLEICVFLDNVSSREKEFLHQTHSKNPKSTSIKLQDFSPKGIATGESLHGNSTTYGRFYLADLLKNCRYCLYLDTDLYINRSIFEFFDLFDDQHILLADGNNIRKYTLDRELFQKANLDLDAPYFNAGVLGIDLNLWRALKADEKIADVIQAYGGSFKANDQSILNLALRDDWKPFSTTWNHMLYPYAPMAEHLEKYIYHFTDSPKPWDFLGSKFSNHYPLWRDLYKETAISHRSPLLYASPKRTLHLARRYASIILRKLGRKKIT